MIVADMLFDKSKLKDLSKESIFAGVMMVIVGAIGIFAPAIMSFVVEVFLGWLFLSSALIQGYITYRAYNRSFSAWLKPFLSFVVGILAFAYPLEGIAATALLLVAYLLVDSFSSFGFAIEYKPNSGWWILIVNALVSIILAVLIMVGWPVSSLFWVGLYAAVSLFVDGIALITLGVGAKKLVDKV